MPQPSDLIPAEVRPQPERSRRLRGREIAHAGLGENLLMRLAGDLAQYGAIEGQPRLEGRFAHIIITPVKKGKKRSPPRLRLRPIRTRRRAEAGGPPFSHETPCGAGCASLSLAIFRSAGREFSRVAAPACSVRPKPEQFPRPLAVRRPYHE